MGRSKRDGSVDHATGKWNCQDCWNAFRRLNDGLRSELPSQWFVEGGQRWSWIVDDVSHGYVEFYKAGSMTSSFGKGWWSSTAGNMDINLGTPRVSWRLMRTQEGFVATPLSFKLDNTVVTGRPQYGAARTMQTSNGTDDVLDTSRVMMDVSGYELS